MSARHQSIRSSASFSVPGNPSTDTLEFRTAEYLLVKARNSQNLPARQLVNILRNFGLDVIVVSTNTVERKPTIDQDKSVNQAAQCHNCNEPLPTNRQASSRVPEQWALTRTETVIANQLLFGHKAIEIANRLNRSIATVRTHIKRIYAKANVHSQAELLRRVLQSRSE